MNARERIASALTGKPPDRVPVMETIVDWKVIRELGYGEYLDMIDDLDLDAVFASPTRSSTILEGSTSPTQAREPSSTPGASSSG